MVKIYQRSQPVGADESGVASHKKSAVVSITHLYVVEINLDSRWGNDVINANHSLTQGIGRFLPCFLIVFFLGTQLFLRLRFKYISRPHFGFRPPPPDLR